MKIYKIEMDLSLVLHRLKQFRLYEYQSLYPIIFVESFDPDGACHKAFYTLASIILKQDSSNETSELIKDVMFDISIRKVEVPGVPE
tara:strand:- start:491 stop:751 length:261 start_codon:yes stop_codon:yes gene_type:complete